MNTKILDHIEKTNYCNQKYHMVYNKYDELEACFIMFPFKYEFSKKLKLNVQLVFLPISAADPGIIAKNNSKALSECLKKIKGIKLILSTSEDFSLLNGIRYRGLPNCVMNIKWNNFEEYINSMRYRYRHRIKNHLKARKPLTVRILENNSEFTREMYDLYLQVINKVDYVLEVLSFEFFQNNFSKTIVLEADNEPKAFFQLIESGDKVIAEFCGFHYKYRDEYNLYYNLILTFVEYAINNGFKTADIGQSAEGIKLQFGADLENKYSWIFYNGNKLFNKLLNKILLNDHSERKFYNYNVFKKDS